MSKRSKQTKQARQTKLVREWPYEFYDIDSIIFNYECEIFDLVDFLMHDRDRLCLLVIDARSKANIFAVENGYMPWDIPYQLISENLYDASYDDHPAMLRYHELFHPNE